MATTPVTPAVVISPAYVPPSDTPFFSVEVPVLRSLRRPLSTR